MLWPNEFVAGREPHGMLYYSGHTLEYVRGASWSGWHCQWCGEQFKTAEEHQHAGLPPMESVETDDLPTEAKEVAIFCLSTGASTQSPEGSFTAAIDALSNGEMWPKWRLAAVDLAYRAWNRAFIDSGPSDSIRRSEAEALIRTGKVTL